MRHVLLPIACIALLALVLPTGARADGTRGPYDGHLPDPSGAGHPQPYHAARIVDADTGRPIEGAWLRGFDEDLDPRRTAYAPLLREASSDADGIAWVPGFDEPRIDHWVVQAEGYAPAYAFGYEPPPVVRLVRGVPVSGRIAGPHGRPVGGLALEVFCGCPHGPVVARLETDADGRFTLPAYDPEALFRLWFVTPRGVSRMIDLDDVARADAYGRPIVLEPGRSVRGRVVDTEGRGVVDAAVRSYGWEPPDPDSEPDFERGPATRTDAEGHFVLHGLPSLGSGSGGAGLLVAPPGDGAPFHWRVPRVEAPELVLEVPKSGPDESPPVGRLLMRARHPEGGDLPRLPQAIAVRADGRVEGLLAATPSFENELPVGRWLVAPNEPFGATTFEPFTVAVAAGAVVERDVVVVQRPRSALRGVNGSLPSLGAFELHTDHAYDIVSVGDLLAGRVCLPMAGDVSLVLDDAQGGGVYHFGPAVDGRRSVAVSLPPPHRVVLVAPARIEGVTLFRGGIEVDAPSVDAGRYETRCRTPVVAVVETVDPEDPEATVQWRVPIDFSGAPREQTIDVVASGTGPLRSRPLTLSWRFPDGSTPEDVDLVCDRIPGATESIEVSGATSPETGLEAPCRVRLSAPGLQPVEADLEPGAHELVLGAGTLVLDALGPDGARVPAVVMVDGELHRVAGDDPVRLRGLSPGAHRVIVTPLDLRWRGVVMTVEVDDVGETTREVRFERR